MFEYIKFLRSPKAEKGEDYGIDYVILEDRDTLTVVARGVTPTIDGDWAIYEDIERIEDLFGVVPEPGGGEWLFEVHIYYPGDSPDETLCPFLREMAESPIPGVRDNSENCNEGQCYLVESQEALDKLISRAGDYELIIETVGA